jgi:hypothetical protein
MKTLICEVKDTFSKYGYRKERNSFWKKGNGFYKLVNFQSGAYGDYFFINVGFCSLPPFLYNSASNLTAPD